MNEFEIIITNKNYPVKKFDKKKNSYHGSILNTSPGYFYQHTHYENRALHSRNQNLIM